jgi:hypothetical protein
MIEIRFTAPRRREHALEWDPVTTIRVDGSRFEIDGDQDFASVRDIEVLDVASGRSVTFDADPNAGRAISPRRSAAAIWCARRRWRSTEIADQPTPVDPPVRTTPGA